MAFKVTYLPGFYSDLDEALEWYNKESAKSAEKLLVEIETTLQFLINKPLLFQKLNSKVRKINLPVFPYKIIYQLSEEELLVIALAHHKRHPRYWKQRKL